MDASVPARRRLSLGELKLGKVDGKHEYLTPITSDERDAFDAFLVPETFDENKLGNSEIYFIEGYRGTGKTSLLRWHAEKANRLGAKTDFVLFKTDLTEAQRAHISSEAGISWEDVDAESMQIAQDFKPAWMWFILHKLGEMIKSDLSAIIADESVDDASKFIRLLGLNDASIFTKAIGFMPKLEGMNVKIKADVKYFEIELGGDFKLDGEHGKVSLDALCSKLIGLVLQFKTKKKIMLYFDELETFYQSPEQLARDQRMVRDILFVVDVFNNRFRSARLDFHVVAAVRTEVVAAMGPLGQEVDRVIYDKGYKISWYNKRRSLDHPLLQIVARKIHHSERTKHLVETPSPITAYFSATIHDQPIANYLLDRSFWKPRDIVWRLTLAQRLFPSNKTFDQDVFDQTEIDYSAKLWDEVRYELSAIYSRDEISSLEAVFAGGSATFDLKDIENRFEAVAKRSTYMAKLLRKRPVRTILADLYRLGALGNSFRTGTGSQVKDRWSFRGEPELLAEKRMVVHGALRKRLAIVVGGHAQRSDNARAVARKAKIAK